MDNSNKDRNSANNKSTSDDNMVLTATSQKSAPSSSSPSTSKEKEALEFIQWIFYGVQAGEFSIEGLVECLLSEQHNREQNSFERFKQALTYLKVDFTKNKEVFFETNGSAKDRKEINKEDLVALRIATENAVEKVLKVQGLEGRPSNTANISAVLEAIKASRQEREALGFSQWIFYGVQAGEFSIEGLVECLLSEQHNREQNSFERFRQTLTHFKVEFTKGKELYFEANGSAKDRKEINKEDLVALRIATENAVERVLRDQSLEGRPSNAANISAVLEAIKASRQARLQETQVEQVLANQMQQVVDAYEREHDKQLKLDASILNTVPAATQNAQVTFLHKDGSATTSVAQQLEKQDELGKKDAQQVNQAAGFSRK